MPKAKKSAPEKTAKPKSLKPLKAAKPDKEKKGKKKDKEIAAPPAPVKPLPKPAKVEKKSASAKPAKPAKTSAPEIVISTEEISLRAYFIAERRQAMGWPGDSAHDWVEAERQLKAETKRRAKA